MVRNRGIENSWICSIFGYIGPKVINTCRCIFWHSCGLIDKWNKTLANLNHCAVPFLSRAAVNLSWYDISTYCLSCCGHATSWSFLLVLSSSKYKGFWSIACLQVCVTVNLCRWEWCQCEYVCVSVSKCKWVCSLRY